MSNEKQKYYVYALIDPNNGNPFYIGKGCGKRIHQHINEAHGDRSKWVNSIKCNRILSIENSGLDVTHSILHDKLTEKEAYEKEIQEISKWGKIIDNTGCLTNLCDGGAGGTGSGMRFVVCFLPNGDIVKTFQSLQEGAEFADVHISTICAALNSRSHLAGGYRWSYDYNISDLIPYNNVTPVLQYNLYGDLLHQYKSVKDAAAAVSVNYTTIVECCTGKHECAGGYRWTYLNGMLMPLVRPIEYYLPKMIEAFDPTLNTVVGLYPTLKDAVQNTKANKTGIIDCCRGRKKKSGGLQWRYVYSSAKT